jgi:cobalamin biosynthesis protein CobT
MSEQEARKYTSICMLREEIRQDMQDYKLSASPQKELNENREWLIFDNEFDSWFFHYLREQINKNIKELKELVEQNNE